MITEKAEPPENQAGTVSLLCGSPELLWAARPWRAPHPALEKPAPQGSVHHYPLPPDTQGDSPG